MLEAALYDVRTDGSIRMLGRTSDAAVVEAVRARVIERERHRLEGLGAIATSRPTPPQDEDE